MKDHSNKIVRPTQVKHVFALCILSGLGIILSGFATPELNYFGSEGFLKIYIPTLILLFLGWFAYNGKRFAQQILIGLSWVSIFIYVGLIIINLKDNSISSFIYLINIFLAGYMIHVLTKNKSVLTFFGGKDPYE